MENNFLNSIHKLSVIGAGQIGPDIMLHFSKTLLGNGVQLVLIDVSEGALQNAQKKIGAKIDKGLGSGALTVEEAGAIKSSIKYSLDYNDIIGSDLVLEAATESEQIKDSIFQNVESLCGENTILLSNSSHLQPEVIFRNIKNKNRCLVSHYFFPADRNPIVELVPSLKTDTSLVDNLLSFYKSIGKVPIVVKSSYGYAIDPIFEGLCQVAIMCLEKGLGNEKQIDKVASEVLGLGVGPFTALNLTGGNPITAHGLDEMGQKLMNWFKTPALLHEAVINKTLWNTSVRDEIVEVPSELYSKLKNEFLGAYFSLASFIIDLGIINVDDLDMGCKLALAVKPPFSFMNQYGITNALQVVMKFHTGHPLFLIPTSLVKATEKGYWEVGKSVESVRNPVQSAVKENVSISS